MHLTLARPRNPAAGFTYVHPSHLHGLLKNIHGPLQSNGPQYTPPLSPPSYHPAVELANMARTPLSGNVHDIPASNEAKEKACSEHAESNPEKGLSSGPDYDMSPEEERRMVRKCDWRILPIVSALYVMSFLNRVNIGKTLQVGFVRRCSG